MLGLLVLGRPDEYRGLNFLPKVPMSVAISGVHFLHQGKKWKEKENNLRMRQFENLKMS